MKLLNRDSSKENRATKSVYILLTRFGDNTSKFVSLVTRCYYTHASIGLEEDMSRFYSFVYKGFIVEEIPRYLKKDKTPMPCELYKIDVCEKVYRRIKKMLHSFEEAKKKFRYTRLGVASCIFGIPYKEHLSYFCSHFVADVLKKCGAAGIKKKSCLYLPKDLRKLDKLKLTFKGNLLTFARHFGIIPDYA